MSRIPVSILPPVEEGGFPQYLDLDGAVLLVLDRAGRVLRLNRHGSDVLGLPEEEVVGRDWFARFIPPRFREEARRAFEALLGGEAGSGGYAEHPVQTASGEERILAWNNVAVRDAAGHIVAVLSTGTDVTERRRAEDERFRTLYNRTPAMLHSIDRDGRIVSVSDYWLERMGYTREEVVGRPLTAFMDEDSRRRAVEEHFPNFFEQGFCKDVAYRLLRKDGTPMEVLLSATAERNAAGQVVRSLAVVVDVTEQKRTEQALRESEARVRAILETTVDGIITIDSRGIIQSFNRAAERIFGYAAGEIIGRSVNVLMPEPYRSEHDGYIRNYLETGHKKIIGIGREVYGRRRDGTTFPMELAVSEVRLDGEVTFTGIVRDITERRRLEQEILRISDQERRRIGQDLHDGLGQMLTGVGLITRTLARQLAREGHPQAGTLAEVTGTIQEADQFARSLSRGLVPVDVDEHGLAVALSRLARNAERLFGITCHFEEVGTPAIYDADVALHLYRIAQEAVSNAVKHGRADHVRIVLAAGAGSVRLRIQDNGVGFPEHPSEERGMGVRIMQYRARIIDGVLDIRSGPEGGTVVTCTLAGRPLFPQPTAEQP
ncbi:PAS domain S-box protein [Rhodocaloribacter litoris]|uniref:PAS domain S-box protein n=1 Tax=Rhodocaloribacter litoris TaxID=2558931 RepID=UPI001421F27A|nr:PAS domain S-box protein [Rhodocaloribacter litoris]QXD14634.1 PAS domain S-box protein [Rhodocaloribacter litoris]